MRIAVWHNLGSGGGKRALYYHVKALKEAGHYVEAWTTDMSSNNYLPLKELISEHRMPLKEKMQASQNIKNILRQEQHKIELMEEHCQSVEQEIEKGEFELLFASSCGFSYMPYIGKFTKLPSILYLGEPYRTHHEAMPENQWQAPYDSLRLKKIKRLYKDYFVNYAKRLRIKKEVEAAKSYKKILVNSLYSRESVLRAYGLEANVCYLGIDTTLFIPSANKEPYVVGLGTISRLKGVHRAIESIAMIPTEKRPPLIWIANGHDPNYLQNMISLAQEKEVCFNIKLNIADNDLINLVGKASVMIYTSVLEPFGLAPLEANACGTYVIAISEGGVRESITNGENGTLINGYKPQEISYEVCKYTSDMNLAKQKGLQARNFVEKNWNEQSMVKNILREIES